MQSQILKTGGMLIADEHSIICRFLSPRLVLSTSLYNGGYGITDAIFNHRLEMFVNSEQDLPGGSLACYLAIVANERGLSSATATGLLTSAHMDCRGYSSITFKNVTVEVVATAGVATNAARAGDAACYCEDGGKYQALGGTINILALTNINLPKGAMAKALISITEAKSAALQELAVVSPSTLHSATGTGTDGIILACDPSSTTLFTDVGTQSKLGELFCRATKAAIKQALFRESALDPWRQGSVLERLRRLDINAEHQAELLNESGQIKLLLAMSQSIWQEYHWGLLSTDELYQFFNLLETSSLQPLGTLLAAAFRQKRTATACAESSLNPATDKNIYILSVC